MDEIRANRQYFRFVALVAGSAITVGLITEIILRVSIEPLLPTGPGAWMGYVFIGLFLCGLFLYFAKETAKSAGKIIGVQVSARAAKRQPPLHFVIMGYSPLREQDIGPLLDEITLVGSDAAASNVEQFALACQLKEHTPIPFNSWQQNLRSAWHHRANLKAIYVLDPSIDQFEAFKQYMEHAFTTGGHCISVIRITSSDTLNEPFVTIDGSGAEIPRTYENYDYVYQGLHRGLELIHARGDLEEILGLQKEKFKRDRIDAQICVDATAGQKIFSIAASVLTLNRPLKFSYVTTKVQGEQSGGDVRFYDTNVRFSGN